MSSHNILHLDPIKFGNELDWNNKTRESPLHHVIRQDKGDDILNRKDGHWREIELEGRADMLI